MKKLFKIILLVLITFPGCKAKENSRIDSSAMYVTTLKKDSVDISKTTSPTIFVITDGGVNCSQCYKSLSKLRLKLIGELKKDIKLVSLIKNSGSSYTNRVAANTIKSLLNCDTTYFDPVNENNTEIGVIAARFKVKNYPSALVFLNGKYLFFSNEELYSQESISVMASGKKMLEFFAE